MKYFDAPLAVALATAPNLTWKLGLRGCEGFPGFARGG